MDLPQKPASTDLPIIESIRQRWSPLAFSDRKIEQEKIETLFEAARWAPSSYNEQPWIYVYATKGDAKLRTNLESLLVEGNGWAKAAYLLVISFAKPAFAKNGKENRHHMHDLGAATGYMALEATALGLVSHQMAGFDASRANAALGVPTGYTPGSMMAIGHPGDASKLPEPLKQRQEAPRGRKTQELFVFRGQWQEADSY